MGPFWAGPAAYHFLPFLTASSSPPPAKGSVTARPDAGGRRYAIEAKAPRSFDAVLELSPLRPLLLEVALPVRRRRVFQQRCGRFPFLRFCLQS